MNQCRLCGNIKKLANAHVIPEAFFRELRSANGKIPILVSKTPNIFPKNSPIGIYDQEILCNDCEPKFFNRVDDYGVKILLKQFHDLFLPITHNNHIVAYQAENIDQDLLLRFLVATLWRASVSKHEFCDRVELGSLEPLAKQTILNPDKDIPKQFSAVLSRWVIDKECFYATKGLMVNPFLVKLDGVNFYRFYFGEIVADIKADTRPLPESLRKHALLEQTTVVTLIARELSKSKDYKDMVNTIKESDKNYAESQRTRPPKKG